MGLSNDTGSLTTNYRYLLSLDSLSMTLFDLSPPQIFSEE